MVAGLAKLELLSVFNVALLVRLGLMTLLYLCYLRLPLLV